MCKEENVDLFIDDAPHYIEDFSRIGIKCLLFDRPWNHVQIDGPNVKRVKNWKEIEGLVGSL